MEQATLPSMFDLMKNCGRARRVGLLHTLVARATRPTLCRPRPSHKTSRPVRTGSFELREVGDGGDDLLRCTSACVRQPLPKRILDLEHIAQKIEIDDLITTNLSDSFKGTGDL